MVDSGEVLELELGGLCSEPLEKCDLVIVEIGALEDVKVPLMVLFVSQRVVDMASNGGLKLSHSRVFHAPQGAHIAVSHVPTVGRQCWYWLLVPVISNSVGGRYRLSVSVLEVSISRPCRCQMHNHRMEHTWI